MKKKLFITWVTYNSRYSERMEKFKVEKQEGYLLSDENRVKVYNLIIKKLEQENI